MSSSRKQRKELARWEATTRAWATETAKTLAVQLYRDTDVPVQPYNVGVVLEDGEKPWVQVPARCSYDTPLPARPGPAKRGDPPPQPPISQWLVTNHRVAGRIDTNHLRWWRWEELVGCQLDLTGGSEYVQADLNGDLPIIWTGPGVAPLAVAAVYHLHGPKALLDHPGLTVLRSADMARRDDEGPPAGWLDTGSAEGRMRL